MRRRVRDPRHVRLFTAVRTPGVDGHTEFRFEKRSETPGNVAEDPDDLNLDYLLDEPKPGPGAKRRREEAEDADRGGAGGDRTPIKMLFPPEEDADDPRGRWEEVRSEEIEPSVERTGSFRDEKSMAWEASKWIVGFVLAIACLFYVSGLAPDAGGDLRLLLWKGSLVMLAAIGGWMFDLFFYHRDDIGDQQSEIAKIGVNVRRGFIVGAFVVAMSTAL